MKRYDGIAFRIGRRGWGDFFALYFTQTDSFLMN